MKSPRWIRRGWSMPPVHLELTVRQIPIVQHWLEWAVLEVVLRQARQRAAPGQQAAVERVHRYLWENREGLLRAQSITGPELMEIECVTHLRCTPLGRRSVGVSEGGKDSTRPIRSQAKRSAALGLTVSAHGNRTRGHAGHQRSQGYWPHGRTSCVETCEFRPDPACQSQHMGN